MTVNVSTAHLYKALHIVFLVAILGLLLWSKPWDNSSSNDRERTITVSGEATLEAEPDEFRFTPYFQEEGTDKDALRDELTTKANTVVDKLKELGVEEKDIKLDASSYDNWYWQDDEKGVLSVSLNVRTTDSDLTQSVQDYLLTTGAEGSLTPKASFSESKRKELDAQAIKLASDDAKSKAEAQAKLFDTKLGDVISVNQQNDSIFGFRAQFEASELSVDTTEQASLPVLAGVNEYQQTVDVVYELK